MAKPVEISASAVEKKPDKVSITHQEVVKQPQRHYGKRKTSVQIQIDTSKGQEVWNMQEN